MQVVVTVTPESAMEFEAAGLLLTVATDVMSSVKTGEFNLSGEINRVTEILYAIQSVIQTATDRKKEG